VEEEGLDSILLDTRHIVAHRILVGEGVIHNHRILVAAAAIDSTRLERDYCNHHILPEDCYYIRILLALPAHQGMVVAVHGSLVEVQAVEVLLEVCTGLEEAPNWEEVLTDDSM